MAMKEPNMPESLPEKSEQERADEIAALIAEEVEKGHIENKRVAGNRVEDTAIKTVAKVVEETLQKRLGEAMILADSPEAVETILINSAVEAMRKELGATKDFSAGAIFEDPEQSLDPEQIFDDPETRKQKKTRIDRLRTIVDQDLRARVIDEMKKALEAEMDKSELPSEISKIHKLLEVIEHVDDKAA